MRIALPPALRAQILAAAQAAAPGECCGLLEGLVEEGVARIAAVHAARNLSVDPHLFQIDPADHIAAQKAARGNGHKIIGCYHSHPGGRAEPSAVDMANAQQNDFIWLIAAGKTLNGFVYSDDEFTGADWVTSSA
jgi:proteasome lid subunit RPN8/RPN11